MSEERYYEVEGAVFKEAGDKLEVFSSRTGAFKPYEGNADRVFRMSNPMTLEEVQPYMDAKPAPAEQKEDRADPAV